MGQITYTEVIELQHNSQIIFLGYIDMDGKVSQTVPDNSLYFVIRDEQKVVVYESVLVEEQAQRLLSTGTPPIPDKTRTVLSVTVYEFPPLEDKFNDPSIAPDGIHEMRTVPKQFVDATELYWYEGSPDGLSESVRWNMRYPDASKTAIKNRNKRFYLPADVIHSKEGEDYVWTYPDGTQKRIEAYTAGRSTFYRSVVIRKRQRRVLDYFHMSIDSAKGRLRDILVEVVPEKPEKDVWVESPIF